MPRKLIIPAWQAHFRRTDPLVVRKKGPFAEIPNWYEGVLNELSKPLAEKFEVSMTAMRIRLERLGLLVRGDQHQTSFNQW